MQIKTTLAAALLALAPTMALAQESCGFGHSKVTMSCAEGTVWDSSTETCIAKVTG